MNLNTPTRKIVTDRDYAGELVIRKTQTGIAFVSIEPGGSESKVVMVPAGNNVSLVKRFQKLQRKARRLGFDEPKLNRVADYPQHRIRPETGIGGWKLLK